MHFMMEIFEFIHLIEISRFVEISDAQKFSGLWKHMYETFTFHSSFDYSMLRKKRPRFLLRPMENGCLIRDLTCTSLFSQTPKLFRGGASRPKIKLHTPFVPTKRNSLYPTRVFKKWTNSLYPQKVNELKMFIFTYSTLQHFM